MWKVMCDCCGRWEPGKHDEAYLPRDWHQVTWNSEGPLDGGKLNLCGFCYGRYKDPSYLQNIRVHLWEVEDQINQALVFLRTEDMGEAAKISQAEPRLKRALKILAERKPT